MLTFFIEGVKRSRRVKTTKPNSSATRHPDLVKRDFTPTAPNQLWVTDLTFVTTAWACVCFITHVCPRIIVCWRVETHAKTGTLLDPIHMARWSKGKHLPGLRWASDAGSQSTSIRYGECLAEIGGVSSIGSIGDSFARALAETVNGYSRAELVRGPEHPGP
jgi:putative transposase